jgi:hypothetical protein
MALISSSFVPRPGSQSRSVAQGIERHLRHRVHSPRRAVTLTSAHHGRAQRRCRPLTAGTPGGIADGRFNPWATILLIIKDLLSEADLDDVLEPVRMQSV